MTDRWRCGTCHRELTNKAYAKIHQQYWPTHQILHCFSEPDIVDENEIVTLAEVFDDPMQEEGGASSDGDWDPE